MARVLIPTPLRQFTGRQDAVTVAGATVGEVLSALTAHYPDLRQQIFNDEDIRYLSKDATAARDGDTISLVPSIAGGSALAAPPEEIALTNDEILRYSRHLIIPEVGIEGQQKLKSAKVLLVGAGGLGAPLGLYLAAAGVGRIGIVDFDVVDFTNLQRQVIHSTPDVGRKKLDSAAEKMQAMRAPHHHPPDRLSSILRRAENPGDESDGKRNRRHGSESPARPRRPFRVDRRARAARI
jgi:adenylyltransferase/sulfurtransferase